MKKKLAIVEYHNGGTFVYRFTSDKEVTLESVVEYLEEVEGWNEDRDSVALIDEQENITEINLDKVLTTDKKSVE